MTLYTFGDSVLDSSRYSGITAGEIVAKELGMPLKHYAVDGATSKDLDRQFKIAWPDLTGGIAMISIGGNDLLQVSGNMKSNERFLFGVRLCRLTLKLKALGVTPYVANIYDPTFGDNERDFLGVPRADRPTARRYYDAVNEEIADCAEHLVDLHAHFLKGDMSWFNMIIEPSTKGAEEIAKAFLEKIQSGSQA